MSALAVLVPQVSWVPGMRCSAHARAEHGPLPGHAWHSHDAMHNACIARCRALFVLTFAHTSRSDFVPLNELSCLHLWQ